MEVNLADVKIKPLLNTIQRLKISDEEYFSKKYRNYISNSRLKKINPNEDGCPSLYHGGLSNETTNSLILGSAVHCALLQPESFHLAEDLQRPSAKLGRVCDIIIKNRAKGLSILNSITEACREVSYYENSLTNSRIKDIIKKGLYYYFASKSIDEGAIVLSSRDRETCLNCLNNLQSNREIMRTLHPVDFFGDKIPSYNEDAIFLDVKCEYKGKSVILKLKMKADNWTIDVDNKKLVLNDLKTTGRPINFFMQEYGSFNHYHYGRQLAMYLWMLSILCQKKFKVDKSWDIQANIIAVETVGENRASLFRIPKSRLIEGNKEFQRLLKMVGICEMFGYDDSIVFN